MSVIVQGMEMPMVCRTCQFFLYINHYDELGVCGRTRKDVTQIKDKRDEDCPLVEIPTEHGRLIDADRLVKKAYEEGLPFVECAQEFSMMLEINAPTVIPAEKDGE